MKAFAHSTLAWKGVSSHILELIKTGRVRRVLEVGGGANPLLSLTTVADYDLEYTIFDISREELKKAPHGYLTVLGDIGDPDLNLEGGYDLIFSRMLAEHMRDGQVFHQNVLRLLTVGGKAFHFFPTLYAPPFAINRLLPERLSQAVLDILEPGRHRTGRHAKFFAYYSWCRGPSDAQIRNFERLGYHVDEYIGFFGHDGYYSRIPILRNIHRSWSNWLVKHPVSWLTSFAYVTLTRSSCRLSDNPER